MNNSDEKNSSPAHEDDLKKQVMRSVAWLGGMKYLGQIISWGITIWVIRILNPGDYGLMAMANVCINFLVMISELGMGAAIIQKKEIGSDQLSPIFGFIILSHSILCAALFLGSPFISRYYSEPRLVSILQVLSGNFLILSMYVIPQSLLIRKMDFKRKSIVDLTATVISGCTALFLALQGYGVWALIWSAIAVHIVNLLGYNILVRNFILPSFTVKGIREFISFGAYTMGSRVLWYFYSKSDIFIGGRILGNQLIGIYSVALELSQIPLDKFMPVINQVAFPAYSSIQSDLKLVCVHFLKAARIGSLVLFPIFWGLLSVAPELLGWLLGDKWSAVILPIQILCLIMPFVALGTLVSPMLFGIGRVDVNLMYVGIASVLMPLSFFIGAQYGVVGLCAAWVFGYTAVFFVTLKLSLPLIGASVMQFLSNIFIAPLAGGLMIISVFGIKYLAGDLLPIPLLICLLIITGGVTYCSFIFLVKRDVFCEAWSLVFGDRKFLGISVNK